MNATITMSATTTTTMPALSAIIARATVARESGKTTVATVARFTRKNGITAPASKVPDGLTISKADYDAYCKSVMYLYNSACKLNANADDKATALLTSALYTCVKDVLALIDPSVEVSEANAVCTRFVADITANAKCVKLQFAGDALYREENRTLNQFVATLEKNLYVIAMQTTFATDYERDYNRAKFAFTNNMKKATATAEMLEKELAKARKALDDAIASKKSEKTVKKAQNVYDALVADITANKEKQAKIEKRFADAKEAFEKASEKASKEA